jgi:hypothetical protein
MPLCLKLSAPQGGEAILIDPSRSTPARLESVRRDGLTRNAGGEPSAFASGRGSRWRAGSLRWDEKALVKKMQRRQSLRRRRPVADRAGGRMSSPSGERVRASAARMFGERGFPAITVRDIAAESGGVGRSSSRYSAQRRNFSPRPSPTRSYAPSRTSRARKNSELRASCECTYVGNTSRATVPVSARTR